MAFTSRITLLAALAVAAFQAQAVNVTVAYQTSAEPAKVAQADNPVMHPAGGVKLAHRGIDYRKAGLPALPGLQGGVIFTTGIPALEKMHGMTAVRPLAPQDNVTVPICAVYLKERSAAVEALLMDLFTVGLSYFGF